MLKRTYFDPPVASVLSQLFRYWEYRHRSPAAMQAELDRQIATGGIVVDPPLPPGWDLHAANYEYTIVAPVDDEDDDRTPASKYSYRILRWHEELYGRPPRVIVTPAASETIEAPIVDTPAGIAQPVDPPSPGPAPLTFKQRKRKIRSEATAWLNAKPDLEKHDREYYKKACMDHFAGHDPHLSAAEYYKAATATGRIKRGPKLTPS